MKNKTKKILLILFAVLVLTGFGIFIARQVYYAPTDEIDLPIAIENTFTTRTNPQINLDGEIAEGEGAQMFNQRLTIPSLDIDAKIQNVGITRKGNMSTPNNFFDVGLYKYGPIPGEMGSAVIAGHVDNGFGFKAVFGNLKNIKIGDAIYVETEEGVKTRFIVTSTTIYDYDAPANEVFEGKDKSYLKLITCSGTWIKDINTHDKRLVVTAVKSDI